MILHDFKCSQGHIFERFVVWTTESVKCECGKVAKRVFLPRRKRPENAQPFEPVVVFRNRDGTFRFPGRSSECTPDGCQRVELRTVKEVRVFERDENRRLKNIHQESVERRDLSYKAHKRQRRTELAVLLKQMLPAARRFAEVAMQQSDFRESESSKAARFDAGFRISVFSDDRTNRPEFRDIDTGWKARRE